MENDWNGIASIAVAGFLGIVVGVGSAKTAVLTVRQMARLEEVRLFLPEERLVLAEEQPAETPIALAAAGSPRPLADGLPDLGVPWGDD